MRAVVIRAPFKMGIEKVPDPSPSEDEVLVRIRRCGICTLERRILKGKLNIPMPVIGGHEVVGEVLHKGPGVLADYENGDIVVLDLLNRCGECSFCRTGHSNRCVNMFAGSKGMLGGMAEYVCVSARQVFKAKQDVPLELLTLTEPISDCVHSLKRAKLTHEKTVLIIGAGTMGMLHAIIANHTGSIVWIADIDEEKLAVAERLNLGSTYHISNGNGVCALTDSELRGFFDIVIVAAPGREPAEMAFNTVGTLGKVVLFASNEDSLEISLNMNRIHYDELTITGSESRTEYDFFQAVSLQSSRELPLDDLITEIFPIEECEAAFDLAMQSSSFRVILNLDP